MISQCQMTQRAGSAKQAVFAVAERVACQLRQPAGRCMHNVPGAHARRLVNGPSISRSLPKVPTSVSTSVPGDLGPAAQEQQQQPAVSTSSAPKRIAIFVEPSPFTYVSGYKNRFTTMIQSLVQAGCEVLVVTTGPGFTMPTVDQSGFRAQPAEYCGAKVVSALSFGCPWYWQVPLTFALSPRIFWEVKSFNPDLIHCTSPGTMVFATKLYAWLLKLPLVLSYHTHVPAYLPRYGQSFLVQPFWLLLRVLHLTVSLTLTTSPSLKDELVANRVVDDPNQIQVWRKGVDSETFHPRYRSAAMRERLSGGDPSRTVLVYVGRLGFEKNLSFLRGIMDRVPNVALAFVGDGPARVELEKVFKGTPTYFLGMLHGVDLSAAYASSDIFVMPSESETLGFVVLEAMASQVPVVAVRAGGIPDILTKQGITGFMYEMGDVEGAAAQVQQLAADAELRARVGLAAREEVSNWDWRAATLHLLNVQYPMAVAAAALRFGPRLGAIAQQALDAKTAQQGGEGPANVPVRPAFA